MCSASDVAHLIESAKENIAVNKNIVSPVVQRAIEGKLPSKSFDQRAPVAAPVRERETMNDILRRTLPR